MAMVLKSGMSTLSSRLIPLRGFHLALHVPFQRVIDCAPESAFVLPESVHGLDKNYRIEIPNPSYSGSMELMAVPKKKTSPHKRGIRNGPKALKPTPVIIRCKACGRVKLPHFYCCSGFKGSDESSSSNS